MKLLIGGKSRNIYKRKDGSAYYKSGGENVDASYMFKKNGDLKKQYIGGVKGNLAKVEKKKRSSKCAKQILGGVKSAIQFDEIVIESENIIKVDDEVASTVKKELKKICCLALYGLGAAMTGELEPTPDRDKINVTIGTDLVRFVKYLKNYATDSTATTKFDEILNTVPNEKLTKFNENIGNENVKTAIRSAGFAEIAADTIEFKGDKCVTVTRAYILNKILQCFEGDTDADCIAHWNDNLPVVTDYSLNLISKTEFINPISGEFNIDDDGITNKLKKVVERIYKICKICKEDQIDNIKKSATNLHTVLFMQEQIGAPAPEDAADVDVDAAVADVDPEA
jgi:hypothetical protein